jgi:hypothetical protein
MKTLVTLTVGTLLFVASGCSSTMTVGPQANKDGVLGASLSTESVSVTLPLIKGTVGTAPTTTKKKK